MKKEYVGAYDLAVILGVHFVTVYRYVDAGMPYTLHSHGLSAVKRFDPVEAKKWLEDKKKEATKKPCGMS